MQIYNVRLFCQTFATTSKMCHSCGVFLQKYGCLLSSSRLLPSPPLPLQGLTPVPAPGSGLFQRIFLGNYGSQVRGDSRERQGHPILLRSCLTSSDSTSRVDPGLAAGFSSSGSSGSAGGTALGRGASHADIWVVAGHLVPSQTPVV